MTYGPLLSDVKGRHCYFALGRASSATPRHGARRKRNPEMSHTDQTGGQLCPGEHPAEHPGPSQAGHQSYRQSSRSRLSTPLD